MNAIEKLNEVKAKHGKRGTDMRPRNYFDQIVLLPEDQWETSVNTTVPPDYQSLVREHLKSFKMQQDGMVRAHADRIMAIKNRDDRRVMLMQIAEPLRQKVEAEVRRRFKVK